MLLNLLGRQISLSSTQIVTTLLFLGIKISLHNNKNFKNAEDKLAMDQGEQQSINAFFLLTYIKRSPGAPLGKRSARNLFYAIIKRSCI